MIRFIHYLFLAYTMLKPEFARFIPDLAIDGAGRVQTALAVLILLIHIRDRQWWNCIKIKPVLIWTVWTIYSYLNWRSKGISSQYDAPWIFASILMLNWTALVIVVYESMRNIKSISIFVVVVLAIYVFFGIYMQQGTEHLYMQGKRMGMTLGNSLALMAVVLAAATGICYSRKWISTPWASTMIVLALAGVFFVSTRKAFGAVAIIIFFTYLAKAPLYKPRNILLLLVALVGAYIAYTYILQTTYMGERFGQIQKEARMYGGVQSGLLSYVGDRAYFYIKGWMHFLKNPWTGIGLSNFTVIDGTMPIHSEYMTELAENGIIGTSIWVLFYVILFVNIVKGRHEGYIHREYWTYLGWLFAILFISLTAWTYEDFGNWLAFGLLIGGICRSKILYEKKLRQQNQS